jgi:amino acid adenylation domain-containing protein
VADDRGRLEQLLKGVSARELEDLRSRVDLRLVSPSEFALLFPRPDEPPLSVAQQRLWFLAQLDPESPFYNIPIRYLLVGQLDAKALETALSDVFRRHEVLRSNFDARAGRPLLSLRPAVPVALPVEHIAGTPEQRQARVRQTAEEEAARPFDLGTDPLLRVRLLRVGPEEHVLLVTAHHIVADGWSTRVLGENLRRCYVARLARQEAALPELPIQYVDYAAWQRMRLEQVLDEGLCYWREKLASMPTMLQLPTDRPRPARQSFRGSSVGFRVPRELVARLAARSREQGATLFMTMLAAFKVLLSRYAGTTDVVVGTPMAGRTHQDLEDLVGVFVNTLVLRTDLSGDPTFRQVLDRVRETAVDAYANEEVPFERLVDELGPERDLSRNPLVQVMFQVVQMPGTDGTGRARSGHGAEADWQGLRVSRLGTPTGATRFDLEILLSQTSNGGLDGWATYSTDLFDVNTVRRCMRHYLRLLVAAARYMDQPISRLPLLSKAECRQLTEGWNTRGERSPYATVTRMFEEQVRRSPHAIAVVDREHRLTYRELNARANRLARLLRLAEVRPESIVGILLNRGADLVVSMLAVWKAGGAYLPLDPDYPTERLRFMLVDAGARVVVSESRLRSRLGDYSGQVVCLDQRASLFATKGEHNPSPLSRPDDLAYVIYTSGSTGQPKGVMVEHHSIVQLLHEGGHRFDFGQQDVWTLFHSSAFDFSVWETWGALLFGGRLVVVPWLVSRSPSDFLRLLASEGVTILNQTPSAFMSMLKAIEGEPGALTPSLRLVIFGGEPLEVNRLRAWMQRMGDQHPELVNMYGITEATVHSTCQRVNIHDLDVREGTFVIGRPLEDRYLVALDEHLNLVPIGVPGELHIGGTGVARGFLGRPGLTAERFIPNPYGTIPGERLYRTGDLVRWRRDGTLEYLGRIDQQVKIRGFRIELGEIEATLGRHPHVREAVVVVRADRQKEPRLVAWVVADQGVAPSADELRTFLAERLPDFMVPSLFVPLESLPMSLNGKVDRAALSDPGQNRPELGTGFVAPRNRLEKLLASAWSEVLGIAEPGIDDNFFALGGHSLLATQLIARLRGQGLECTLVDLLRSQSIRDLGSRLAADDRNDEGT